MLYTLHLILLTRNADTMKFLGGPWSLWFHVKRVRLYWVISDPSAYTCDFNLYLGAAQYGRSEQGLAYIVVIALFQYLLTIGVTATGAVWSNRRGVPQAVAQVNSILQHCSTPRGKGYYIRDRGSPIVYTCWNNNQAVCSRTLCRRSARTTPMVLLKSSNFPSPL